jgi:hypothetical protein
MYSLIYKVIYVSASVVLLGVQKDYNIFGVLRSALGTVNFVKKKLKKVCVRDFFI